MSLTLTSSTYSKDRPQSLPGGRSLEPRGVTSGGARLIDRGRIDKSDFQGRRTHNSKGVPHWFKVVKRHFVTTSSSRSMRQLRVGSHEP